MSDTFATPDYPWVVGAIHRKTGQFSEDAAFPTEERARAYCARMKVECKSHEAFVYWKHDFENQG